MAQLGARLDGIEEVEGSNPFGSTSLRLRQRSGGCRAAAQRAKAGAAIAVLRLHEPSPLLRRCFPQMIFARIPAMSGETFHVERRPGLSGAIDILTVKGPITQSTSPAFQEAISTVTAPRLIVDLTEMPSVDSQAVGALVRAFVTCNKAGRRLAFVGLNHRVKNVLKITGVEPLFDTYASVAEAESRLN